MKCRCYPIIPGDWVQADFIELAAVNPAYPVSKDREYPFVEMAAVAEDFGGILSFDSRKPESSGLAKFTKYDTIFGKITPCAENGKVAYVDDLPDNVGLGSTEFIVLSPRPDCDPRYLYAIACSHPVRGRAISRMEGSTGRLRVTEDTFTKWLVVPKPPADEQAAIVRILNSVDRAIEATRATIDKAQRVKDALMQQLLTCGIGEDGRMRDHSQQQAEFHKTHAGLLPKCWVVHPLSELAFIGSGITLGKDLRGVKFVFLPYLRVANVQDGFIDTSDLKLVEVRVDEVERFSLQKGDVLMTEGGDFDKLGRGGIWQEELAPCLHQNHIFRVRPDQCRLTSEYLALLITSDYGRRYFLRIAKQTTNLATINKTQLGRFLIPLPPMNEQREIVRIVEAADICVQAKTKLMDELVLLKRGLMQDLLTGKVRTVRPEGTTQPAVSREPVGTGR